MKDRATSARLTARARTLRKSKASGLTSTFCSRNSSPLKASWAAVTFLRKRPNVLFRTLAVVGGACGVVERRAGGRGEGGGGVRLEGTARGSARASYM